MFEDTRRHGILDADLVLSPSPTFGNFDTTLTGSCGKFVVTGLTTGDDVSVLQMGGMNFRHSWCSMYEKEMGMEGIPSRS